ncbi:DNA-directed RNA polymerase subunit beta' [Streptococcus pneumoniae]|nr:DNA-directed RNA polymerase subunit beta' [Streptococcus pneumoniae]
MEVGQSVERGEVLTEGSIEPKNYLSVAGLNATESYLLKEVQKVYRMQGVEIDDKHVEVMVRQMLRKVRIIEAGDTKLLPGSLVDIHNFTDANRDAFKERKRPATAKPVLLGITKASLETESFLSAASFQETTRVLTDAAIKGKRDDLLGLKENVIIGKLIPAGTGMRRYSDVQYDKNVAPVASSEEEVEVTE